jgi:glycosyltransferase involved in cell wall biosynthesis
MRILHTVESYHPSVGGAQWVVRQISERLVKRGHRVTVATAAHPERMSSPMNGVEIREFAVAGNLVRGMTGELEAYRRFLVEGEFDVMMSYAAQQWATDAAFAVLDAIPYARVLAPCGFSALWDPAFGSYFEELPNIVRRYDGIVLHSDGYRDGEFLKRHGIEGAVIIPNGAGEDEFAGGGAAFRERFGIGTRTPMILTVGSHTGLKGHDAAIAAFSRARLGRAVLVVIGNGARGHGCLSECRRAARRATWLSLNRQRVLLLDPPRPRVVEAFAACDLFVLASSIECFPVVLAEAMASGAPFVSTPCGNARELAERSGAGIVVPGRVDGSAMRLVHADVPALAAAMAALVHDPARRAHMGAAGRSYWREALTWEAIAVAYERRYEEAMSRRRAPAVPGGAPGRDAR